MADISKVTLLDNTTYDIKDAAAMEYPYLRPILSKTYTNVIATSNDDAGAGFFYAKIRGTTYNTRWRVTARIRATVPSGTNADLYNTDSIVTIWGTQANFLAYEAHNHITSTSYRPIYYHSLFLVSSAGYTNGCGTWLGFNLKSSTNQTSASLKRTVVVDILEYKDCELTMSDTLITPANIPDRSAHDDWYTSTDTALTNIDCYTNGNRHTGDQNTETISKLYHENGAYTIDSALYRYQLLFQMGENRLTPLNNANNDTGTSKTMLTNVEFDPLGKIFYYGSSTTQSAGATVLGSVLYYSYPAVNLKYTFNVGTTLITPAPVYLVVTITDSKAKIANSTPWTQELPSTADGYYYIYLGRTYSNYQISLSPFHPVYYYDGGIKLYNNYVEYAAKKDTVLDTTLSRGRTAGYAVGEGSFAFGSNVVASNDYGHAEGLGSKAGGNYSHAEGYWSEATNTAGHAENKAKAYGAYSHAEGESTAYGDYSHAEGKGATNNSYAHAEGYNTNATATYSHAEGIGTTASGAYSHAEGAGTVAAVAAAHAEGSGTQANALNAHAEGGGTKANGDGSHSEGNGGIAYGASTHAEGGGTKAIEQCAHAEGGGTIAFAGQSHSEGYTTHAYGVASHAEGYYTSATSAFSHAGGAYNVEDSYANLPEWVSGNTYNVGDKVKVTTTTDTDPQMTYCTGYVCTYANSYTTFSLSNWDYLREGHFVEIIGNGTSSARSNARALRWDGNEYLAGDIYVGCNSDSTGGNKVLTESDMVVVAGTGDGSAKNRDFTSGGSTFSNVASGIGAYAFGFNTIASANGTFVAGSHNTACAGGATSIGQYNTSAGSRSLTEGLGLITTGMRSHAEGFGFYGTIILTGSANATQYTYTYSNAIAVGDYIVYNGKVSAVTAVNTSNTTVTVSASFVGALSSAEARIYHTYASGTTSHIEGTYTIAASENQHVQGKYNVKDANGTYADIVGCGTAHDSRANAYTLDWSGNGRYKGDVYAGCNDDSSGGSKLAKVSELSLKADKASPTFSGTITGFNTKQTFGMGLTDMGDNTTVVGMTNYNYLDNLINPVPDWVSGTSYKYGDIVYFETSGKKIWFCITPNDDASFTKSKWASMSDNTRDRVFVVGNGWTASNINGSNALTVNWNGDTHIMGDLYVNANSNGTGGSKLAKVSEIPDISTKADKTDTVLTTTLSRGRTANQTIGEGSCAFGASVIASGSFSHAEGGGTTAQGMASHAEGSSTLAQGWYSHSEGNGTISYGVAQHVSGEFNSEDSEFYNNVGTRSKFVEMVGNGTANNNRSNARTLDWDGNEYLAGNVYVDCNADSTGGNRLIKLSEFSLLAKDNTFNIELEQGNLDSSTGDESTTYESKRLRSDYIYCPFGYNITVPSGYRIYVYNYNTNNASGFVGCDGWLTGTVSSTDANGYYIRLVVSNTGNTDLTPSSVATPIQITSKIYKSVNDVQINDTSIVNNSIASIPIASDSALGVVKVGTNYGVVIDSIANDIRIDKASDASIKGASSNYKPIVSATQHMAAFYGLAKAAGDTTQASSSNAVGTYTAEAQSAIQSMIGIEPGISLSENVSGSTPSLTCLPNVRYNCGEVSTISITPPASGTCDVFFTSGSTAAVLTIPNTVKFPSWFVSTVLDTNTIYEIIITDGVYGSVMTWGA